MTTDIDSPAQLCTGLTIGVVFCHATCLDNQGEPDTYLALGGTGTNKSINQSINALTYLH